MGLHIHMVCDFCSQGQSASFDSPAETYENLLDAYRGMGWRVNVSDAHKVVGAACPECLSKFASSSPEPG